MNRMFRMDADPTAERDVSVVAVKCSTGRRAERIQEVDRLSPHLLAADRSVNNAQSREKRLVREACDILRHRCNITTKCARRFRPNLPSQEPAYRSELIYEETPNLDRSVVRMQFLLWIARA